MTRPKGRPSKKQNFLQRQMISIDSRHTDALKELSVRRLGEENLSGLFRLLATEALVEAGLIKE